MPRAAKTWRGWTTKELERLEVLRLDGQTAPQIASALNRTVASVRCRLASEQLTRGSRLARYIPLVSVPHFCADVARQLGCSLKYVTKVKRKLEHMGFNVYRQRANQSGPYRILWQPGKE